LFYIGWLYIFIGVYNYIQFIINRVILY